jgi:natural product precursor
VPEKEDGGKCLNFLKFLAMNQLKLNTLANNRLHEKEMNFVIGGEDTAYKKMCGCACKYANSGGSSTEANASANAKSNLSSPGVAPMIYIVTSSGNVYNLIGNCLNCE